MPQFVDVRADNLDDAWSNFDPDVPLESGSSFFVHQKPTPIGSLKRALLRQHRMPQKYFLAGFKGSGKSTQINQLASDPELLDKYFVVDFSIRDTSDERNIDYVDLLIAIGGQLFTRYVDSGGELAEDLLAEVQTWGSRIEERIRKEGIEIVNTAEFGASIGPKLWLVEFFAKVSSKIKTESSSRATIREVLKPRLTDLLSNIDLIATGIQAKTKKNVLVFVDDTDKPLIEQASRLFRDHLSPLLQPNFYIVYTVPVWMHYSDEFPDIRSPKAFMLPNIKLHDQDDLDHSDEEGESTMRGFISSRMDSSLIEPDAMKQAIRMSGGVFRECARIMQMSIDHALETGNEVVAVENVDKAVEDLRRDYRRLITSLSDDELVALKNIGECRRYQRGEAVSGLLNNLLVLEYINGENWPDVNPILRDVLRE